MTFGLAAGAAGWGRRTGVVLWAAMALAAQAQTAIHGVHVVSETASELTLEVDYSYSADHGPAARVSAQAQDAAGSASSQPVRTGFRPGIARPGRSRTRVAIIAPPMPMLFSTEEILIRIYQGIDPPLASATFRFPKTWSQPSAELVPVLRLLGGTGPSARRSVDGIAVAGGGNVVERRFAANGEPEIVYRDGSVKRLHAGGYTITHPDGTMSGVSAVSLQPPTPPAAPPDDAHARWLQYEAQRLLELIRTLVGANAATVENYLAREPAELSPYARISVRRQAVQQMVEP